MTLCRQTIFNEGNGQPRSSTHDISRTSFHIKHVGDFARSLEEVCICPYEVSVASESVLTDELVHHSRPREHFPIVDALRNAIKQFRLSCYIGVLMTYLSCPSWRIWESVYARTMPLTPTSLPFLRKTRIWN